MQLSYRDIFYQYVTVKSYANESEGTAMHREMAYKINEKTSRFGRKIQPLSTNFKYRGMSYIRNAG